MYDPPGGTVVTGSTPAVTTLAFTGFSMLFFTVLALTLIVGGLVLLRALSVRLEVRAAGAARHARPPVSRFRDRAR